MKKYGFLLWVLLVTIGVMSAHTGALAQVTNVPLFIVEYDNQTSANTVSSPYYYLSERIVENNPGDVSTVSLTYPEARSLTQHLSDRLMFLFMAVRRIRLCLD